MKNFYKMSQRLMVVTLGLFVSQQAEARLVVWDLQEGGEIRVQDRLSVQQTSFKKDQTQEYKKCLQPFTKISLKEIQKVALSRPRVEAPYPIVTLEGGSYKVSLNNLDSYRDLALEGGFAAETFSELCQYVQLSQCTLSAISRWFGPHGNPVSDIRLHILPSAQAEQPFTLFLHPLLSQPKMAPEKAAPLPRPVSMETLKTPEALSQKNTTDVLPETDGPLSGSPSRGLSTYPSQECLVKFVEDDAFMREEF